MKSVPVAEITRRIGSTIVVGITSDPDFAGDETVLCNLKVAGHCNQVPRQDEPVVLTMTEEFAPADGDNASKWCLQLVLNKVLC